MPPSADGRIALSRASLSRMSNERERHRGRLFENRDKKKPSQPDMQGDGRIGGKAYAITAWEREDQLVLSLAAPRSGTNTYPPEEFRGALEHAHAKADKGEGPLWAGDIAGEEGTYAVRAYQRQGKSGAYLDLELEPSPPA